MIELTTEQKAIRFTEDDKRSLYNKLTKDLREQRSELISHFSDFILSLLPRVVPQDIQNLGNKAYVDTVSSITIKSEDFGLPKTYKKGVENENPSNGDIRISISEKIKIPMNKSKIANDNSLIIGYIKSGCTKDELNQIAYFISEYMRLDYETSNFGLGEIYTSARGWYNYYFKDVTTLGQLKLKYPKYFEVYWKDLSEEIKGNNIEDLVLSVREDLGF